MHIFYYKKLINKSNVHQNWYNPISLPPILNHHRHSSLIISTENHIQFLSILNLQESLLW